MNQTKLKKKPRVSSKKKPRILVLLGLNKKLKLTYIPIVSMDISI